MVVQVKPNLERQEVETTSGIVDLNQADAKTLTQLPGIGPTLAARIVAHREDEGPFLLKEDLMDVPGIADTLYAQVADRIDVTIPTASELTAREAQPAHEETDETAMQVVEPELSEIMPEEGTEEKAPEGALEGGPEGAPETPQTTVEAEVEEVTETEETPDEDALSAAEPPELELPASGEPEHLRPEEEEDDLEAIPLPDIQPEEESEMEVVPLPPAGRERTLPWLWPTLLGALLGGLLGVFFSILVFAGINGSIDVGQSRAMQDLRGEFAGMTVELDAIRSDVSALQGDVRGIRERVDVLAGLTARMEEAEAAVETLKAETESLKENTTAIQSAVEKLGFDINAMAETLDVVEAQTEKSMTFFEKLGALLQEVFEEVEPQGSAPNTEEVDG